MNGHAKPTLKTLAVLLASSALAFTQVNVSPPAAVPQSSDGAAFSSQSAYPAQTPRPIGAGTINYVEGQASLGGVALSPQSVGSATLQPNQLLDTGSGYVEVLLTPGAFLRLGHDSEARMITAGLADTQVELVRGSAMLEVDQLIKGTDLSVIVNGATARIEKTGLYDFDGVQGAIKVLDGKAKVVEANGSRTLGKNDEVLLASRRPLRKRDVDENAVKAEQLYIWSKARSEDEAKASASAANNPTYYVAAGPGWFWDPYWDFYGFWPANASLYSPFGWGFYSPAFFGYYGGYGYAWYGHPGFFWHGHPGAHGYVHGRVGGMDARVGGFHEGGFHGGFAAGGFHGGGHR
jgi:hypothetical protein